VSIKELTTNMGEDLACLKVMHDGIMHASREERSDFSVTSLSDDEDDLIICLNEANL